MNLIGVKMEPPDMPLWLDDEQYDPFWKKMEKLGLIFSVDLGWDPSVNEYNFQVKQLENIIKKFPELKVLIQHLGVSYLWEEDQKTPFLILQKILKLKQYSNVWFDITGLPEFCPTEEYPFPRAQKIMKVVVETIETDRLIWGSDFPGILIEDVTYKQTLNLVKNHCTFLTEKQKEMILGGNALNLFKRKI